MIYICLAAARTWYTLELPPKSYRESGQGAEATSAVFEYELFNVMVAGDTEDLRGKSLWSTKGLVGSGRGMGD